MSEISGRPDAVNPARPRGPGRLPGPAWLAAALSAATLIACAVPFASAQSIWLDETAQLSGLSLGPVEVTRWLMGVNPGRFGLPSDRMPPLSYWIGWAWGRAFGGGESSIRALGIAAVALAAALVSLTAGRLAGSRAAFAAGLLFALSPNVVAAAPEIRAYPLYLTLAAGAFLMLVGYAQSADDRGWRWLLGLLTLSLAATYTHFFGLVLGGAAIGSASLLALLARRALAWPVATGVAFLALALGLKPFVSFSVTNSAGGIPEASGSFPRLVYRLIGHPAVSVDPPVLGMMLAGFLGLLILGTLPRRRDDGSAGPGGFSRYRLDLLAVPIALALGLGVTFLAGLKVRTFEVYKPSYSLWAVPAVCIVAGSAFANGLGRRAGRLTLACLAAALAGSAWSEGLILTHRQAFSHGPERALEAMIGSVPGDRRPVIVHEDDPSWPMVYFPLRLRYGPGLEEYRVTPGGEGPPDGRPMEPLAGATSPTTAAALPADRAVVVIRSSVMGQAEIRREIRGGGAVVPTGELMDALAKRPGWREIGSLRSFASIAVQARIFVRDPGPSK